MHRLLFFVKISLVISAWSSAGAEDWYRYRGPRLDGISAETEWRDSWPDGGPKIGWKAEVGTGFSSVSTSEGRAYTIGNNENVDTVYCLDCRSGEVVWQHAYTSPTDPNEFEGGPTSTPTVDESDVYTLSRRGDLFCFDKVSGDVRWSVNVADKTQLRIPAWGYAGSPLVWKDLLILNVGDAGTAVDKKTGTIAWSSADKDSGYSTAVPIPDRDDQVVIGSARSYVCVDARSGREIWRQRWLTTFGCNAADAIVTGQSVFLSSGYNRGSALLKIDGDQPEVVWKNKEMQNQISSSVLIDGMVIGIHGDVSAGTTLRCIDLASGQAQWTSDMVRPGGFAATADRRLIIISDSGELVIGEFSASGFNPTARQKVFHGKCWTSPVLSDGRLYCRSADGTLVCVDLR